MYYQLDIFDGSPTKPDTDTVHVINHQLEFMLRVILGMEQAVRGQGCEMLCLPKSLFFFFQEELIKQIKDEEKYRVSVYNLFKLNFQAT